MLKKINKIKIALEVFTKEIFKILIFILNTLIRLVILIGAISAIVLVYKMFPEIALLYLEPLYEMLKIVGRILKVLFIILGISAGCYIASSIIYELETYSIKLKKKKEIQREKFLKDLAKKLNKKLKIK